MCVEFNLWWWINQFENHSSDLLLAAARRRTQFGGRRSDRRQCRGGWRRFRDLELRPFGADPIGISRLARILVQPVIKYTTTVKKNKMAKSIGIRLFQCVCTTTTFPQTDDYFHALLYQTNHDGQTTKKNGNYIYTVSMNLVISFKESMFNDWTIL